ncbi:NAD(P)H-hydrate dehydratase [Sphingorhabdus sp. Alg239-R122]|uniref:NAD(P)H-hydrate dehydratase n=1 Tax=Sphingorhabdus sp. Alg239-R122 TaxID=2305989 RepID=UPI0013DA70C0|nr:NAD(P)H-hydrate dehydratase [Sphingorhabdus sp. Alg239-R122]
MAQATDINSPQLWRDVFPKLADDGHKYNRGYAVIFAGGLQGTGAARLAARGALRIGAGLVTIAVPASALMAHAGRLPDALMVRRVDSDAGPAALLDDRRINALCIGPAYGVGEDTVGAVRTIAAQGRAMVLDADVFTSFASAADDLADILKTSQGHAVLTPHAGEFTRLFADKFANMSPHESAAAAASHMDAVIVLKGPETVIAAPDGRITINSNAPPDLATAGSGDVLSGFITGLLAQDMPAYEAACAGVWLHGKAGNIAGAGLIADDLPEVIRGPLSTLRKAPSPGIGFGDWS